MSLVTLTRRFVAHYFDQPPVSPPFSEDSRNHESGQLDLTSAAFFLLFFFQRIPDARPSSGYTLKPERAGRSHFARYTKIGDATAIDEIAIHVEHLRTCTRSDERVATALCKSTTTRRTWWMGGRGMMGQVRLVTSWIISAGPDARPALTLTLTLAVAPLGSTP